MKKGRRTEEKSANKQEGGQMEEREDRERRRQGDDRIGEKIKVNKDELLKEIK